MHFGLAQGGGISSVEPPSVAAAPTPAPTETPTPAPTDAPRAADGAGLSLDALIIEIQTTSGSESDTDSNAEIAEITSRSESDTPQQEQEAPKAAQRVMSPEMPTQYADHSKVPEPYCYAALDRVAIGLVDGNNDFKPYDGWFNQLSRLVGDLQPLLMVWMRMIPPPTCLGPVERLVEECKSLGDMGLTALPAPLIPKNEAVLNGIHQSLQVQAEAANKLLRACAAAVKVEEAANIAKAQAEHTEAVAKAVAEAKAKAQSAAKAKAEHTEATIKAEAEAKAKAQSAAKAKAEHTEATIKAEAAPVNVSAGKTDTKKSHLLARDWVVMSIAMKTRVFQLCDKLDQSFGRTGEALIDQEWAEVVDKTGNLAAVFSSEKAEGALMLYQGSVESPIHRKRRIKKRISEWRKSWLAKRNAKILGVDERETHKAVCHLIKRRMLAVKAATSKDTKLKSTKNGKLRGRKASPKLNISYCHAGDWLSIGGCAVMLTSIEYSLTEEAERFRCRHWNGEIVRYSTSKTDDCETEADEEDRGYVSLFLVQCLLGETDFIMEQAQIDMAIEMGHNKRRAIIKSEVNQIIGTGIRKEKDAPSKLAQSALDPAGCSMTTDETIASSMYSTEGIGGTIPSKAGTVDGPHAAAAERKLRKEANQHNKEKQQSPKPASAPTPSSVMAQQSAPTMSTQVYYMCSTCHDEHTLPSGCDTTTNGEPPPCPALHYAPRQGHQTVHGKLVKDGPCTLAYCNVKDCTLAASMNCGILDQSGQGCCALVCGSTSGNARGHQVCDSHSHVRVAPNGSSPSAAGPPRTPKSATAATAPAPTISPMPMQRLVSTGGGYTLEHNFIYDHPWFMILTVAQFENGKFGSRSMVKQGYGTREANVKDRATASDGKKMRTIVWSGIDTARSTDMITTWKKADSIIILCKEAFREVDCRLELVSKKNWQKCIEVFSLTNKIISDVSGTVFVHCRNGRTRSAVIVLAYYTISLNEGIISAKKRLNQAMAHRGLKFRVDRNGEYTDPLIAHHAGLHTLEDAKNTRLNEDPARDSINNPNNVEPSLLDTPNEFEPQGSNIYKCEGSMEFQSDSFDGVDEGGGNVSDDAGMLGFGDAAPPKKQKLAGAGAKKAPPNKSSKKQKKGIACLSFSTEH